MTRTASKPAGVRFKSPAVRHPVMPLRARCPRSAGGLLLVLATLLIAACSLELDGQNRAALLAANDDFEQVGPPHGFRLDEEVADTTCGNSPSGGHAEIVHSFDPVSGGWAEFSDDALEGLVARGWTVEAESDADTTVELAKTMPSGIRRRGFVVQGYPPTHFGMVAYLAESGC